MEKSLYFFLEPYVYIRTGDNGVLLVNLIDDNAFAFDDKRSLEIAESLLLSKRRTAEITEQDAVQHLVVCARKNYIGDTVYSELQPFQFYSEINVVSWIDAYKKAIVYSKNDICSHITDCTIFLNPCHPDCNYCISLKTGTNTVTMESFCEESAVMSNSSIYEYTDIFCRLNPNIKFFFCGVDPNNLKYIVDNIPRDNYALLLTDETLLESLEIIERINIDYILMSDLSDDSRLISDFHEPKEIWTGIENKQTLERYYALRQKRKIKPFLIMNAHNVEFIKSIVKFSKSDVLGLRNKYKIIKSNNIVNSNYWGHMYLFPNGQYTYSLSEASDKGDAVNFYNDYKQKFFTGDFDWTRIRNYKKCRRCSTLCPSPTNVEDFLRRQNVLDCLMEDM